MKKVWPWIFGVVIVLIIGALLLAGRGERQAYWAAKGAIEQRTEMQQERIDAAVDMATAAVDAALELSAGLPSQEAYADLVKQDIEEIGNRLTEASEARGDAAVAILDEAIMDFNDTLENVENASEQAESEAVKSTLDRIYGMLEATKEALVQVILNTQE
jgi:molecular chaperone GrpE (heat shock protein)